MRKLESRGTEEKRRKRNQLIIGLILVFVMLISVLGYGFQTQEDPNTDSTKVEYNGYTFTADNSGYWLLKIGNADFYFRNNPNEVNASNSVVPLLNSYSGKPLYIYSESQESELELYRNLDNFILRRQYACLDLGNNTLDTAAAINCSDELPLKTCEDNFLIIEEAIEFDVYSIDNCVFIKGPKNELIKATDEFLFKTLGIRE